MSPASKDVDDSGGVSLEDIAAPPRSKADHLAEVEQLILQHISIEREQRTAELDALRRELLPEAGRRQDEPSPEFASWWRAKSAELEAALAALQLGVDEHRRAARARSREDRLVECPLQVRGSAVELPAVRDDLDQRVRSSLRSLRSELPERVAALRTTVLDRVGRLLASVVDCIDMPCADDLEGSPWQLADAWTDTPSSQGAATEAGALAIADEHVGKPGPGRWPAKNAATAKKSGRKSVAKLAAMAVALPESQAPATSSSALRCRAYAVPKEPPMPPVAPAPSPKDPSPRGEAETLELLHRAHMEIEALAFRASTSDAAMEAFETFRRAVTRAVDGGGSEAWEALERMSSKPEILEFLAGLSQQRRLYTARINSVVRRLQQFSSWRSTKYCITIDALVASSAQHLRAASSTPTPEHARKQQHCTT